MKKVKKSFQTFIIVFIVGAIVPKLFPVFGNSILNKGFFKIVLSFLFYISTVSVGFLYSSKIIKGKRTGGVIRVRIFLCLVLLLPAIIPLIFNVGQVVAKAVAILMAIAIVISGFYLFRSLLKYLSAKNSSKTVVQPKTVVSNNISKKLIQQKVETKEEKKDNLFVDDLVDISFVDETANKKEYKTLYELWNEKDIYKKCLTAYNCENSDLQWVKIYHAPYGNGKFYGYVKMENARDTVNGEIYFADRKIWIAC